MSIAFQVRARRDGFALDVGFETEANAIAVIGPSGAGKTTLLTALAGLGKADDVRLDVDRRVIVDTSAGLAPPPHRRGVGYVFQGGRLFPHLTVASNVGFSQPYVVDPLPISDALRLVDLEGFGARRPASLSGGELRRVAIARALVGRPRLLLLDEPFTGLDARRREALIPYLLKLRDEIRTPMIIVSHDARDVADLAHATLALDHGRRSPVTPPQPSASD